MAKFNEKTEVRAFHIPTQTWRWSALSCMIPGEEPTAFRVDTQEGEQLSEFKCWTIERNPANAEEFRPVEQLELIAVYS